jgi:hypothetical protein
MPVSAASSSLASVAKKGRLPTRLDPASSKCALEAVRLSDTIRTTQPIARAIAKTTLDQSAAMGREARYAERRRNARKR